MGKEKQVYKFLNLRQRAQDLLQGHLIDLSELSTEDVENLIHELRVHQIELELQNEELHRTQQDLQASNAKLTSLYDFAPVGYLTLDEKGVIHKANLTIVTMLGIEKGDLINRPLSSFIVAEDQDTHYLHQRRIFKTHASQTYEIRLKKHDELHFYARLTGVIVQEDEDDVNRCRVAVSDINKLKEAERDRERLTAERERRLLAETLTEVTLALTSHTDPSTVLQEILRQAQRLVSFETGNIALLENDTLCMVHWHGYEKFGSQKFISHLLQPLSDHPLDAKVVRSRKAVVVPDVRREPGWVQFEDTAWIRSNLTVPILLQNKVLGLIRLDSDKVNRFSDKDVECLQPLMSVTAIALENARLHLENKKQAQQLQQVLDTVKEGILLLDPNHRIELANPAAQTFLSALSEATVGDVLSSLGERPLSELLKSPPKNAPRHELVITGPPEQIFELSAHPLRESKETTGWVLLLRDVSLERQHQQYIQKQDRLATVGQLAAGIAHDFNNIMVVITLYAQTLLKTAQLTGKGRQRLVTIHKQAQRAVNLIGQILDFSRSSIMERAPLNLLVFLKELEKLMRRTLPENIHLVLDYKNSDYTINADPTRLQQIFMNLAINARDAMPEGGTLHFELTRHRFKCSCPLPHMPLGEWIQIDVTDTGIGMSPEVQEHLFEPFFTTKPPGKGTGLGLAQVYGIVKQHEGYLDVVSQEGEGTKFTIYLPALTVADIVSPPVETAVSLKRKGETILLVEDDIGTQEALYDILEFLQYRVLVAADGQEAMTLYEQHHDEIALILSDMIMPNIGGMALYTALKEKYPKARMLIMTGYPLDENQKMMLKKGKIGWIQKPFSTEQLAHAFKNILGSR